MTLKFGGGSYPVQCPVCDCALRWPTGRRRPEDRIAATAHHHEPGCQASVIDPARLRRSTREEALAMAAAAGDDG